MRVIVSCWTRTVNVMCRFIIYELNEILIYNVISILSYAEFSADFSQAKIFWMLSGGF